MNIKTEITKLHYNKDAKGFLFNILKFASLFYGIGSNFKNYLYDKKYIKPKKVDAYVISVGNLTTGGVGKTPVVAEIAKYLIQKGEKVAVISRGYGGRLSNKNINLISDGEKVYYNARFAGDEPYWLAQETKAVVVTSKNRYKAAEFAIKEFGVTKIILDDGFQHRKLYRDLDLILMDSEKQFGNECVLPAGPLREGIDSISRANKLIIVSKNTVHDEAERLSRILENRFDISTSVCKTEPDYVYNIKTNFHLQKGTKVVALSAIGQPEQFFEFLNGFVIDKKIVFDDHHQYIETDIPKTDCPIITTEKDAVKIKEFNFDNIFALKLKTEIDAKSLLED